MTLRNFIVGPVKRLGIVITAPIWITLSCAVLVVAFAGYWPAAGFYWIWTGKNLNHPLDMRSSWIDRSNVESVDDEGRN